MCTHLLHSEIDQQLAGKARRRVDPDGRDSRPPICVTNFESM